MAQTTDDELLDRYARRRDEAAFAELARRHLGLVYAAAVRRVGDRHLAEDVTQAVFVILARRAAAAGRRKGALAAWLLRTVRYAAANALKVERRRRQHEGVAARVAADAGGDCSPNPSDVLVWREVAARLDDAVLRLPAADRQAILLRFFERRPVRDVAVEMGVTEGAAKQRLSRSVAKLRDRLDRGGSCLAFAGTAGLVSLLSTNAAQAAPAALVASTLTPSVGGQAVLSIAKGAMTMMTVTKAKLAVVAIAAAAIVGTGAVMTINHEAGPHGGQAVAATAGGKTATLRAKAQERVRAAENIVAYQDKAAAAGEAIDVQWAQTRLAALRLAAEARVDAAAGDPAGQVGAAERYVRECRQTAATLKERFGKGLDASEVPSLQAEYQIADAEYLLENLRASK